MTQRRTALASFPRSGNTWLRYLLEGSTGRECGSRYNDRIMPRGQEGVAIKTHDLDSHRYTHAIHLVRNPFDAIYSYYNWKRDIANMGDVDWDQHVTESARQWAAHANHWLNADCVRHRVRYEDLHADPLGVMRRLLPWLGFENIPDESIQDAIAAASLQNMRKLNPQLGKKFFREGKVGKSLGRFSGDQIRWLHSTLADLISRFGYRIEGACIGANDGESITT